MSLIEAPGVPPTAPTTAGRRVRRRKMIRVLVPALFFVAVGLVGIALQLVPGWSGLYMDQTLSDSNLPPLSAGHLLGTDHLGRDLGWRLVAGLGVSLEMSLAVTAISALLGLTLGILSGFYSEKIDKLVSVIIDVTWAFPTLLLAVVFAGALKPGVVPVILALSLVGWASFARIVRGEVMSLRQQEYVLASQVLGYRRAVIAIRHVLPNLVPVTLVMASYETAHTIISESGLSFIGLGAQPPTPSLGIIIADGHAFRSSSVWPVLISAVTIAAFVLVFNTVGDVLRDIQDPRMRSAIVRPGFFRRLRQGARETSVEVALVEGWPEPKRGPDTVLEARGLHVGTTSGVGIISGVTLSIKRGETVGIVGESGSGKTVTALAVMGLLPEALRVTGGDVFWSGKPISAMSREELREGRGSQLGMIFQDPMTSLDPACTIGAQIVEIIRTHQDTGKKEARQLAINMLERVGIPEPASRFHSYPHELSGGQRQRAMIAGALVLRPAVLIADEPTTALDVTTQKMIIELVQALQAELGMAVVWITHDLGIVREIADRVVVMYAGEQVESAGKEALFAMPRHPYTSGLIRCRPDETAPVKTRLLAMEGQVPGPGGWPAGCRFVGRCSRALPICSEVHAGPSMSGSDGDLRAWRCHNPEEGKLLVGSVEGNA